MPRSKSISSRKHRKVLKLTKGYKHSARRRIKAAKEAVLHAGKYAYVGRKQKKRNLRSLWIIRLNAATRREGVSYSKFIKGLKDSGSILDRKILAEIAVKDPKTFTSIVNRVKESFKS